MPWPTFFSKQSNEECAKFLCQYMQNVPHGEAYETILKFIVGGIMVSPCFRFVSQAAEDKIVKKGRVIQDLLTNINLSGESFKNVFKNDFKIEHTIPISYVIEYLSKLPESDINEAKLLNIIKAVRGVALVTQDENKRLDSKYKIKLPDDYKIEELVALTENLTAESEQKRNEYYLCRYRATGIECTEEYWSPETGIK